MATPFATVMLLGLFWWRANYASAVFGLIGGFIIHLTVGFGLPAWLNHVYAGEATGWIRNWVYVSVDASGGKTLNVHWLYLAFLAQVLILIGMVIVARFTRLPDRAAIASYVWSPSWWRQFQTENPRPWYQSVRLWFGIYAAIWCALYWRFW